MVSPLYADEARDSEKLRMRAVWSVSPESWLWVRFPENTEATAQVCTSVDVCVRAFSSVIHLSRYS